MFARKRTYSLSARKSTGSRIENSEQQNRKSVRRALNFPEKDDIPNKSSSRNNVTQKAKKRGGDISTTKPSKRRRKSETDDDEEDDRNSDNLFLESPNCKKIQSADIGIIEKVVLKNFMCHSNLEFKFGPNVNFIIGHNGSGKSAVLNGIMLALGSRAASTGRGQNLGHFIQTGKQAAYASVTIKNKGPEAYQSDVYGPWITVERKICSDGRSGSYRIKGANGKLVSQKREELNHILDAFNIHVDNPVSVLTQDASKFFLDSKDPKKKYNLFFRATQLEKLQENYREAENKRKSSSVTLQMKKKVLPDARREVQRWYTKYKQLQILDKQRDTVHTLQNQIAWAAVIAREKKEAECRAIAEKFEKVVENIENKVEENESQVKTQKEEIQRLKAIESTMRQETAAERTEHENRVKKLSDLNREIQLLQIKHGSVMRENQTVVAEIKTLENSIKDMSQRSQDDLNRERQAQEKQLKVFEQNISDLKEQRRQLMENYASVEEAVKQKEQELTALSEQCSVLDNARRNKEYEISAKKKSMLNQESLYGQEIPILRRKIIEACRRGEFRREPIGPIGLHLKVVDVKWSFAIEKCLSRDLLRSFCVDNTQDSQRLKAIMKEVYRDQRHPSIVISPYVDEVHDVSYNMVQCRNQLSVFDSVSSEIPMILNVLIDQRHIEGILLVEDPSVANRLMLYSPPAKCRSTFVINGDQIFPAPNHRYYSNRTKPNNYSLLQRFDKEEIKNAEAELRELQMHCTQKYEEKKRLEREIFGLKEQLKNFAKGISQVKKEALIYEQKKKDLVNLTETEPDVTSLNEDLRNQKLINVKYEKELEYLVAEIAEKKAEFKGLKAEQKLKETDYNAHLTSLNKMMQSIESKEMKKAELVSRKQQLLEKLQKEKQNLKEVRATCNEVTDKLEKEKEAALRLCPRIETREKIDVLKSRLAELEKEITQQNSNINREEVMRNYVQRQDMLDASKKEISSLQKTIDKLEQSILERYKKFEEIRRLTTLRVQYLFQTNMQSRNFLGKLEFNHAEATLVITANPSDSKSAELHKTQKLSGGERSFVTVALLMALSDASEMPFHILDEYDVFMDSMNKEHSLKMMMAKADEQRKNQFIFLSPLNLPPIALKYDNLVRIHKMADPVRNNSPNKNAAHKET